MKRKPRLYANLYEWRKSDSWSPDYYLFIQEWTPPDFGVFPYFIAMGELYSRLPQYYKQVAPTDAHTSLHKQFSSSSLELQSEHSSVPLTVHKSEDGTMFASILTKSNTEQLARQGSLSLTVLSLSINSTSFSLSLSAHHDSWYFIELNDTFCKLVCFMLPCINAVFTVCLAANGNH